MPRVQRPWFRFYTEAIWDRKLRGLPPEQRWVWVAVLALSRQSPRPGFLMVSERQPATIADVADAANVPPGVAEDAIRAFGSAEMLHEDAERKCWVVTNWSDRQYESDNVTNRTRAFRERSQEHRRNVPRNDNGTPPENREQIQRKTPPLPPQPKPRPRPSPPAEFGEFWKLYPRREGKGNAEAAFAKALKLTTADVILSALTAQLPMLKARERDKQPHPATWLNGRRWEDEIPGATTVAPLRAAKWRECEKCDAETAGPNRAKECPLEWGMYDGEVCPTFGTVLSASG